MAFATPAQMLLVLLLVAGTAMAGVPAMRVTDDCIIRGTNGMRERREERRGFLYPLTGFQDLSVKSSDGPSLLDNRLAGINVTAQVGSKAYLTCDVPLDDEEDDDLQLQVSWIRLRDWHILSSGLFLYTKEERFKVHHNPASRRWVLVISYVSQRDEGNYECQILRGDRHWNLPVHLRVVSPRAYIPGNGEHHVDAGSTISLSCFIEEIAVPPHFVFWYHNSRMINYDSDRGRVTVTIETAPVIRSLLTVTNATMEDSGNYTCAPDSAAAVSIDVYITQVNQVAAVHPRAVGSTAETGPHHSTMVCLILLVAEALFGFTQTVDGTRHLPQGRRGEVSGESQGSLRKSQGNRRFCSYARGVNQIGDDITT